MSTNATKQSKSLDRLAASLEVPESAYRESVARYHALARHLEREESRLTSLRPRIHAQGSFEIGTVTPPLDPERGFDLDLLCEFTAIGKLDFTQKELKDRLGHEVGVYAKAHGMNAPVEKPRCWHVDYRGEPHFHMDVVPAVPEDEATKNQIASGVVLTDQHLVSTAVALTDWSSAHYDELTDDWTPSNPRGYADWFRGRMRDAADRIFEARAEVRKAADVPAYEWKTPLQRAVQILKRHRDVMFREDPDSAPISCIITTLAARAYTGHLDLREAIISIISGMPDYIASIGPYVPNPTNPEEDFAHKWDENPNLKTAFWRWHSRLAADVQRLGQDLSARQLQEHFSSTFGSTLSREDAESIVAVAQPVVVAATPSVRIEHKPEPWATSA